MIDNAALAYNIGLLAGAIFFIDGWGPSPEDESLLNSRRFRGLSIIISGSIITPVLDYIVKDSQPVFFLNYLKGCVEGWLFVFLLGLVLYLIWKETKDLKKGVAFQIGEFSYAVLDFIYLGISVNPHLKAKREHDIALYKVESDSELADLKDELDKRKTGFQELDTETAAKIKTYEEKLKNLKTENDYDFYDWYYKGVTEFGKQEYEKTIAYMKNAVEKTAKNNDDVASALLYIGASYDTLGLYQKSLEINDRIAAGYPGYKELDLAFYNKGVSLKKMGLWDEALKAYEKAEEINPSDPVTLSNMGGLLLEMKRYKEALVTLDRSLKIDDRKASAWVDKGTALNKMGSYEDSDAAYDKAVAIDPRYADAYYGRACNYAIRKDKINALILLQKAVDLDATLKEYVKTDTDFNDFRDDEEFKKIIA